MTLTSQYETILNNLSTAVIVVDVKLQVRYLNLAAEVFFETSLNHMNGEPLEQLFTCESDDFDKHIQTALEKGIPFTKRQTTIKTHTQPAHTVDYTVTPVINDDATALLIEIQSLDRLLRIRNEKTIWASQQTTKTFVRGLAHEIKNPLGGLRGAAQLLEKQLETEDLKDYTQIIIEEADRLTRLVDQLLGPRSAPKLQPLNIHEVLERVYALVDAERMPQIELQRDYDPSIPDILGDKEMLIQATLNVVRNAMQALKDQEQGEIVIRSRTLRQFTINNLKHSLVVRIDICDNGPGIEPELIDTLFLPMVTTRAEGNGLGLSISQNIMNQHHGLIQCASRPGATTFSLFIPLELKHA